MKEILSSVDWQTAIATFWTVVFLPIVTGVYKHYSERKKTEAIDKYTSILQKNVVNAVKDVYETVVKDIKDTDEWTDEKKEEVKELAKNKAIFALSQSAYQMLTTYNPDFEEYLDTLVGTALYDIKR